MFCKDFVLALFLAHLFPPQYNINAPPIGKFSLFSLTYLTTVYKLTPSTYKNEYSTHCFTHTILTAAVIIEVALNITFYIRFFWLDFIPFIHTNNNK